jgi:hypothetical protein
LPRGGDASSSGSRRDELTGQRIAFMASNEGMEEVEFIRPWQAVLDAGGMPELLAPVPGVAQAFNHLDKGDAFPVDRAVGDADPAGYPDDLPAFCRELVAEFGKAQSA